MDLEKVTAKIRPRKHWEAIDLGVALTQRHAKSLYKIWFLTTFPVYLICAMIFHEYAIWVIFGFWFLLPLWERPLLHFLSRELFGERLSVKDCVKSFFRLAKIQWFASLTWRRPSFTRSLDLPIVQLEGLSGRERSNRLKVIHSIGSGAAVWLTILFLLTETIFYFAILILAYLFLPEPIAENIDLAEWIFLESESSTATFVLNLISYLAISFVTPFYIASGFAIYLNQRTHLEAWDIELAFKRLAQKLKTKSESHLTRLASGLLCVCLISILTMAGSAKLSATEIEDSTPTEVVEEADEQSPQTPHNIAKAQIKEVMAGEDFHYKTDEYRLVSRSKDKKDEDEWQKNTSNLGLWSFIGKFISFLVEFALWVFVALLIIFLLMKYRHLITGIKPPQLAKKKKPQQLFGLDMQSESLPDKPWQVALTHVEAGEFRQGLSLLYRASLIWYIEHTGVLIREGDTELECLRKIQPHGKKRQHLYMTEITSLWRALAYAHQTPQTEGLVRLCEDWPTEIGSISEEKNTTTASGEVENG